MLYVTLLDQFHPGIYSSQVIDVCNYLNEKHNSKIRVVAFLSLRELLKTNARAELKALSPTAIVFPSFPGIKNFQFTAVFLFFICLFTGQRTVICRNAFCARTALRLKKIGVLKKVVLDGRSAMAAEIKEYDVFPVDYLRKGIVSFEGYAVNHADFRIAVSEKLVAYWREHYQYTGNDHVVIPCTLDSNYFSEKEFKMSPEVAKLRSELGFGDSDIVLAYSGSTAPWQSFELLEKMLTPILDKDKRIKILFLSKENNDNKRLREKYKDRVLVKWLQHKQVPAYLHCCDYGILVREQSDTNKVASPVKFAEYLYSGLRVLISENLGDFSEFVRQQNCGYVLNELPETWPAFEKVSLEEKTRCFRLAHTFYKKESEKNSSAYSGLVNYLSTKH